MSHDLIGRGREAGLTAAMGFTQDNLTKRTQSSTMRSHRLVLYVAQKYSRETSERLYDVLNRRHFIEGAVLNDISFLLDAATEVGVARAECEAFLRSREGEREVLQTVARVQEMGVNSIPTLVVDGGKYVLEGASHSSSVLETLRRVVADKKLQKDKAGTEAPSVFQKSLMFNAA
jgi:predicted DsbA family dithiol-disulfide isomerase